MSILNLRRQYHQEILREIIRIKSGDVEYPNFADKANKSSREIAWGIVNRLGSLPSEIGLKGQTAGGHFEEITSKFLDQAFGLLSHLRPGRWQYSTKLPISSFSQYEHLAELENVIKSDKRQASSLGQDYIIAPDIVVGKWPVTDDEINTSVQVIAPDDFVAKLTPFRDVNVKQPNLLLHASISCQWALRSD